VVSTTDPAGQEATPGLTGGTAINDDVPPSSKNAKGQPPKKLMAIDSGVVFVSCEINHHKRAHKMRIVIIMRRENIMERVGFGDEVSDGTRGSLKAPCALVAILALHRSIFSCLISMAHSLHGWKDIIHERQKDIKHEKD